MITEYFGKSIAAKYKLKPPQPADKHYLMLINLNYDYSLQVQYEW